MALSEVSICNQAMGWVGANLIVTLDVNDSSSIETRLCAANYAYLRDAVMEEIDWSFALTRMKLTPTAATPLGYGYEFLVPSSILRVVTVTDNSNRMLEQLEDWVIEGGKILTNSEVIYIRALNRVEEPSLFSPMFAQCLAARIAMDLAIPLSQSQAAHDRLKEEYIYKMNIAASSDGRQGRSQRTRTTNIQRVRLGGRI